MRMSEGLAVGSLVVAGLFCLLAAGGVVTDPFGSWMSNAMPYWMGGAVLLWAGSIGRLMWLVSQEREEPFASSPSGSPSTTGFESVVEG